MNITVAKNDISIPKGDKLKSHITNAFVCLRLIVF